MQYLGFLSVRRYNLVNSFSAEHPVVFQMPPFIPHGMCPVHTCCSGVLSLHFVSSCFGIMRHACLITRACCCALECGLCMCVCIYIFIQDIVVDSWCSSVAYAVTDVVFHTTCITTELLHVTKYCMHSI